MTSPRPKRPLPALPVGLAASALRRVAPGGALFRLLAGLEPAIRDELHVEILALGQTYDALA